MDDTKIRLTIRSGGWVLILLGILILAMLTWALAPAILRMVNPSPGDGTTIESYEFDLSNLALTRETIVPAMIHRDMSPVLTDPIMLSAQETLIKNSNKRNQYLVSNDLVVGIELADEVRCYPLHVLNVHEVVNDTIGGVPIVVYWNWPSGHAAVFERTYENRVINFGLSGLSGNGSMLLYANDETEGDEQLFSMMQAKSITGSDTVLTPITHEVTSWGHWFADHPETSVLAPNEHYKKRYRKGDPRTYFLNDTIYFPASPMPEDGVNPKTLVLAIATSKGYDVYNISELDSFADENHEVHITIDGSPATITVGNNPLWATVKDSQGNQIQSQRALWFAWYANHPDAVISSPNH
ncbi:MAG: DUF3179 domain-containing (seleno)protein [Phycisphaerales bacterium]|jgi:hypothetical protein|nr:DUF3179 domain-containing (seleno)protein [Phycisphaerales bacterium]